MVYKSSRMFLLETKRGILLLKTMLINQNERNSKSLNSAVDRIVSRQDQNCCITFCTEENNYVGDNGSNRMALIDDEMN